MGLVFCVIGLNRFFYFIPDPKAPTPEGVVAFAGALMKTGCMFALVMGAQRLTGALLSSSSALCRIGTALSIAIIIGSVLSREESTQAATEVFPFEQTADPFGTDNSRHNLLDFSIMKGSKLESGSIRR